MTAKSRPAVKARERLVAPAARSGEIPEPTVESGWEKAQQRAGHSAWLCFANPLKSFNARRPAVAGVFLLPAWPAVGAGDSEGIVVCRRRWSQTPKRPTESLGKWLVRSQRDCSTRRWWC